MWIVYAYMYVCNDSWERCVWWYTWLIVMFVRYWEKSSCQKCKKRGPDTCFILCALYFSIEIYSRIKCIQWLMWQDFFDFQFWRTIATEMSNGEYWGCLLTWTSVVEHTANVYVYVCVCVVIAEPHRKWPGTGNLTGLSLSTASTTPVHNYRANAFRYFSPRGRLKMI